MRDYIFCICCSLYLTSPTTAVSFQYYDNQAKNLSDCVVKLIQEWDVSNAGNNKDITFMNINNDLDLSAIHKMERVKVVSRTFSWNTTNVNKDAYIIDIKDYNELQYGLNQAILDVLWDPKVKFIIIIRQLETEDLKKIQKLLKDFNMFDVTLISHNKYGYAVYISAMISIDDCFRDSRFVFISQCSEYSVDKKKTILPSRKHGLRNCYFRFMLHKLWPYSTCNESGKVGLEQYALELYKQYSGAIIDLELYEKKDEDGYITADCLEIALSKVENNEVEGAIGGYTIELYYHGNISYTYPFMIDHMIYVFPFADVLNTWEGVVRQSLSTWLTVGILFIFFSTAASLLSLFPKPKMCIIHDSLSIFGFILNKMVFKKTHSGLSQRIILASLYLLALIFPYILQACLFSFSYNPARGFEPQRVEDIGGYTPIIYTGWINRYDIGSQVCRSRFNCLAEVKNSKNNLLYTLLSKTMYDVNVWKISDDQCKLPVYTLKQTYRSMLRTVFLRRGSILQRSFDEFFSHVTASGLLDKYLSDIYQKERRSCKYIYKPEQIAIDMSDIQCAFIILLFGYFLSTIAFFCEFLFGVRRRCARLE